MTEQEFKDFAEEYFPGHEIGWGGSWYYISANPFITSYYHFEYNNGKVEFHIEGRPSPDWKEMRQWMKANHTPDFYSIPKGGWRTDCVWTDGIQCSTDDEIKAEFLRLRETVFPIIDKFAEYKKLKPEHIDRPNPSTDLVDYIEGIKKENPTQEVILLGDVKLAALMSSSLNIPPYQRIYCWTKKNVDDLLKEIRQLGSAPTHLGSIILHRNGNKFDVVDGQQRLVTLTLLLEQLEYKGCLPLIDAKFESEEARNYIAYNKYLCNRFAFRLGDDNAKATLSERILSKIEFSILIIDSSDFELAYTFFSNANSKGKPLSDYNLLKAHHLRYIESIPQQLHLAKRWDGLTSSNKDDNDNTPLDYALGTHILHLRKWFTGRPVIKRKYIVRDEYVASPTIEDIPPFGEKFDFYEKIQGGQHFFAFAQNMVERYKVFIQQPEHSELATHLAPESHWSYGERADALLFGYYLKFGTQYLAEALFVILTAISRHRHSNGRALANKIEEFVAYSGIVQMLHQATSPTFFLADLVEPILNDGIEFGDDGIRKRYEIQTKKIYENLLAAGRFIDDPIVNLIKEYHGIQ